MLLPTINCITRRFCTDPCFAQMLISEMLDLKETYVQVSQSDSTTSLFVDMHFMEEIFRADC